MYRWFYPISAEQLENTFRVKAFVWNGAIYVRIRIAKAAIGFIASGDISTGANTFSGSTLRSGNYEGEIRDIAAPPRWREQMGEPLTLGEQVALRSELGMLMGIARISRPGALYGASI